MSGNSYTTITNIDYYESLKTDALEGETCWSINKNARSGDRVILYVCAPVSAIVATAIVSEKPYKEEDINSEFFGTWFAEMHSLQMLEKPISRIELLQRFPDWKYWKQPRNSVLIPAQYESELFIT